MKFKFFLYLALSSVFSLPSFKSGTQFLEAVYEKLLPFAEKVDNIPQRPIITQTEGQNAFEASFSKMPGNVKRPLLPRVNRMHSFSNIQ